MTAMLLKLSVGAITLIVLLSLILAIVCIAVVVFFCVFPTKLWLRAKASGVNIEIGRLISLKMKKIDPAKLVVPYISAVRAGLNLNLDELESFLLAGGNVEQVVKALISAQNAGIDLSLQSAMAFNLAGKNVCECVQSAIVPIVVETPTVSSIAKNGVEVKARASVTLKANIRRMLGGSGVDTILARVSEGLSSAIGSAVSHSAVMENPDVVSSLLESKGYDNGSAYDILSIDIFDMAIGTNYAILQNIDHAEATKKIEIAKNEERKARASAEEQENKARYELAKAKVIECEAEVPKALAKAIEEGKISAKDYMDLQNIQADTNMRNSLAKSMEAKPEPATNKKPRNPFDL